MIKGTHYFAQLEQINIQVQLACCALLGPRARGERANKAQRNAARINLCIRNTPPSGKTFIGLQKAAAFEIFKAFSSLTRRNFIF